MLTHHRLDILYNTRDRVLNGVAYRGPENIHHFFFLAQTILSL